MDDTHGWLGLLNRKLLSRTVVIAGGSLFYAVNMQLNTTIMPTVVKELGGLEFYAWSRTVLVTAAIVSAAVAVGIVRRFGQKAGYLAALAAVLVGTVVCALAPNMPVMLIGRAVQGFGTGLLFAFTYALIPLGFPERAWPFALALVQAMFGVACLLAPALGGLLAESGDWRLSIMLLAPATVVFGVFIAFVLPNDHRDAAAVTPVPTWQLVSICAIVAAVSAGSLVTSGAGIAACLAAAALLLTLVVMLDSRSRHRLLPRLAPETRKAGAALYAVLICLCTLTSFEVYGTLFLQRIHDLSPVGAGYIIGITTITWSLAGLFSAGIAEARGSTVIRGGLALIVVALVGELICFPTARILGPWTVGAIALCIGLAGVGVGLSWPHVLSTILRLTPLEERDHASSSMSLLQQFPTAAASAAMGLLANAAGLRESDYGSALAFPCQVLLSAILAIALIGLASAMFASVPRRPMLPGG